MIDQNFSIPDRALNPSFGIAGHHSQYRVLRPKKRRPASGITGTCIASGKWPIVIAQYFYPQLAELVADAGKVEIEQNCLSGKVKALTGKLRPSCVLCTE